MGREPDRIGYFSFTRKATTEAINRAVSKFDIERKNLEWFRTLHSCAYRWLNLSPSDIIGKNEFLELYKETGIDLHDSISSKDNFTGSEGDGFSLLDLYRVKNTSLEKELYDSGIHVKGGLNRLLIADKLYRVFKKRKGVMDFTDIIMKFNKIGLSPNLGVVIIDEVQDLKPIEWDMVRIMMQKAEKVYLAGDDDQAIYSWSGADV
jgi:DNA helicase-2/ATP-dependent DNA helicase PcrA